MNIVILSENFWPKKDAEAYCATRFASALAACGHTVHVVTEERPSDEFGKSYDKLIHPNIRVTRVPVRKLPYRRIPRISLRYFAIGVNDAASYPCFIKALRSVLMLYDKPILVSRTFPIPSLYIAWHCRKFAYRWVAHFSDPLHWQGSQSRLERLQHLSNRLWLWRTFCCADAISVTCKRAIRYYHESFKSAARCSKWIVATHIGDTKLNTGINRASGVRSDVIAHFGDMYAGRGYDILDAVEALNNEGIPCELVQDRRPLDKALVDRFIANPHFHVGDKALANDAKISVVLDFNVNLSYSPFLMSKFVYQIYEDRPIVVVAKADSAKHDYCTKYPNAGLFFGEQGNLDSIKKAILDAMKSDPAAFDRSGIRKTFSEEQVANRFSCDIANL